MPIANGTRIGPYEVVGWIGAGGMGEVYRARDGRLGRDVAIKLIAETVAGDQAKVRRFEQEARAVGQLSHPNVLAVYDVGFHDGSPYIVSELLEGESLRSLLQNGLLSPRKAVDYARQTAEGLAAAHDKNIVHRDIKPDNLFITADGRVKILDFGIAKLTRRDEDSCGTSFTTATAEGLVVGTAGYMSPEQVRGEDVDGRSDIFSCGAVLYEMLAGQPAFVRSTAVDTMSAILKDDPTGALPAKVPPGLQRIIARCLEKTREMRFQSARDLAFGLEVLTDTGVAAAQRPKVSIRWRSRLMLGSALAVAMLGGAAALWVTRGTAPQPPRNPLAAARFSKVTDWPGMEAAAEISADGKFVVFLADRDGPINLFLSQLGTANFSNLTKELPALSAPGPILKILGFSGDSGEVWFTKQGDSSAPKWLLPLTGGSPRPFLDQGKATPSWSPDDRRLVYFINNPGDQLYLADRTGANAQPLVVDDKGFFATGMHNHNPVWSPEGTWIYFAHGADPQEDMNVWRVRPSGGKAEQLTTLHSGMNYLAPIDSRTLLYIARDEDRSGPWLWSLDVDTKATARVTSGLEHFSSVSASRDGRRVVATVSNPTATLWTVPILDRMADDHDAQRYLQTNSRAFAPRYGKDMLFYLSDRGAGDGLWRSRNGESSEIWKPERNPLTEPVAVSPDGSSVALLVRQDGKLRVSVMTADGTNAHTLAPSIEVRGSGGQGAADWSPDGQWLVVAVSGSDAVASGIFKIPRDGGAPTRLTTGEAFNPIWSPDGTLIVYTGAIVSGLAPLLGVKPDGSPVKLPDVMVRLGGGHRFLPDGNVVYLPRGQSLDFWLLDLATQTTRPLTHLSDQGTLRTFDIARDGKSIVFDRSRENADIYLIDLPK
jgi:Tol biopolymer transport system component